MNEFITICNLESCQCGSLKLTVEWKCSFSGAETGDSGQIIVRVSSAEIPPTISNAPRSAQILHSRTGGRTAAAGIWRHSAQNIFVKYKLIVDTSTNKAFHVHNMDEMNTFQFTHKSKWSVIRGVSTNIQSVLLINSPQTFIIEMRYPRRNHRYYGYWISPAFLFLYFQCPFAIFNHVTIHASLKLTNIEFPTSSSFYRSLLMCSSD